MHYAFQDKEYIYLIMDHLGGGDLRYHIIKNYKFNESKTSKILKTQKKILKVKRKLKTLFIQTEKKIKKKKLINLRKTNKNKSIFFNYKQKNKISLKPLNLISIKK